MWSTGALKFTITWPVLSSILSHVLRIIRQTFKNRFLILKELDVTHKAITLFCWDLIWYPVSNNTVFMTLPYVLGNHIPLPPKNISFFRFLLIILAFKRKLQVRLWSNDVYVIFSLFCMRVLIKKYIGNERNIEILIQSTCILTKFNTRKIRKNPVLKIRVRFLAWNGYFNIQWRKGNFKSHS